VFVRVLLEMVGARLLERDGGPHQLLERRLHAAQDGRHCASGLRGAGCPTDGRSGGDEVAAVVVQPVVGVATRWLGGERSTHVLSLAAHEARRNAVEPPYRAGRGDGIVVLAASCAYGVPDGLICSRDLMAGVTF